MFVTLRVGELYIGIGIGTVETRRSDDLYTGASPDGDGVEAERWPLLWAEMVEGRRWGEAD